MHNDRRSVRRFTTLIASLLLVSPVLNAGSATPAGTVPASAQLTNRLIVKFRDVPVASGAFDRGAILLGDKPALARAVSTRLGESATHRRALATGAELFELQRAGGDATLRAMAARLAQDPNVEYAEPDALLRPLAVPNDSRYNEQWHYFEGTGGLNLPAAWDNATGAGVVVAVIDTGYRAHADLAANLLPGYDMIADTFVSRDGNGRDSDATDPGDYNAANECGFGDPARDSSWHGTHVAGTVAAVTNNGSGVAGVAYGARVVPVRVLGRCGGYTSDIADGIVWASGGSVGGVPSNSNPAQVLNLSLGGSGSCSATTQSAINTARANGATVVVAAGNSSTNASNANPANCSGVVAVAATNRNGGRAYYSNFGAVVDLAAPGGDVTGSASNGVLSTLNSGSSTPGSDNYEFYQGTSMATPHVAGLAALLYSVDPTLTPDQVESTIKSTARPFPASCSQCGAGIADAAAAVAAVGGGGPGGGVLDNGVPETGLSGSTGTELRYTLDVPAGATNLSFGISGSTGDADLYVRFGDEPTLSTYDCRPWLNGNNETCDFPVAQTGTYHVMVQGYTAFSGVSLVGSFDEDAGGGADGGTAEVNDISASRGQWVHYTLELPAGMAALDVDISGGTGDADLYVRYGAQPTTGSYDCRPYRNGNNESCSFNNPAAGTWYLSLRAYRSFSNVDLDVVWNP